MVAEWPDSRWSVRKASRIFASRDAILLGGSDVYELINYLPSIGQVVRRHKVNMSHNVTRGVPRRLARYAVASPSKPSLPLPAPRHLFILGSCQLSGGVRFCSSPVISFRQVHRTRTSPSDKQRQPPQDLGMFVPCQRLCGRGEEDTWF
jgi:hypothetical protein